MKRFITMLLKYHPGASEDELVRILVEQFRATLESLIDQGLVTKTLEGKFQLKDAPPEDCAKETLTIRAGEPQAKTAIRTSSS